MRESASWSGSPSIKGSTESMRYALLAFSLIGLQFTWGIEMTYCTPYLLQLGLTKSKTSLVWVAGPLSGLIMQPVVGVVADRSTSKYGRRRPFMVVGSVIVACCLLLLGWTKEVVGLFIQDDSAQKQVTIVVAVVAIYAVDFAINAVQACCRSLIVDTLPISQQQQGSAWAARMATVGHIVGYLIGSIDMVTIFGNFLGDTQFKKMCVISGFGLLIAVAITCWAVTERILVQPAASERDSTPFKVLSTLFYRTIHLPKRIRGICWVQFWSWIGWFPFLFYSSTWVGETYFRYEVPKNGKNTPSNGDTLGTIGRLGSISLIIFSTISFLGAVVLPYCVVPPETTPGSTNAREKYTPRPPPSIAKTLYRIVNLRPDLITAWGVAHGIFAFTFLWAPFVRSVHMATVLVGLAGIPWAIVCWAPFAEMGVEINKMASGTGLDPRGTHSLVNSSGPSYQAVPHIPDDVDDELAETELVESGTLPALSSHPSTHEHSRNVSDGVLRLRHDSDASTADLPSTGELAGIYLGVLNVYTTLPQFVGTFISWVVFSILEPNKDDKAGSSKNPDKHKWLDLEKEAPNAISVCLFVGALSAMVAVVATIRLKRNQ